MIFKSYYSTSTLFKKYKIFELVVFNSILSPILLGLIIKTESGISYFIYFSIAIPFTIFSIIAFLIYPQHRHYLQIKQSLTPKTESDIDFMNKIKEERALTLKKYSELSEFFHNTCNILLFLQACGGLGFLIISKILIK